MIIKGFEKHLKTIKGAIHVGANIGEERDWYEAQGFTKVLWFEPNKSLFNILKSRIAHLPHHMAFNKGIHDTLKEAVLHISNNDGQSSSILELGTHAISHPSVKYIGEAKISLARLDWIFDIMGWDINEFNFLNVDVQGVELNVIKSLGEYIKAFDYVYAEVNTEEVYKECCLLPEIDNYLSDYGFKRIETTITRAKWGDALYSKV